MNWPWPPFEIPTDIAKAWKKAGQRGRGLRKRWEGRLKHDEHRAAFERAIAGDLPANAFAGLDAHIAKCLAERPAAATRVHSGSALEALIPAIPEMIGGSADLTGSNNTIVKGMTAAMNGMSLHGGLIPYSGTFLTFSDYSRAAIRLGALMGTRVIHVMTH